MAKIARKKDSIDIPRTCKLLKALADSDRLRLVLHLREGEKNVGTLANALGAEIVNVSHHLGVLRGSGVVKDRKVGRFVYYTLNPDVITKNGSSLLFRLAGCSLVIA